MDSRDQRRLAYEPPQLLRLTAPGDAEAANCIPSGSGASDDCSTGQAPGSKYCIVDGSQAATVCSGTGSSAGVCSGVGSGV